MWQQDRQGDEDSEEGDPEDESGSSDDNSQAVSPHSPAALAHSQSQPGLPCFSSSRWSALCLMHSKPGGITISL